MSYQVKDEISGKSLDDKVVWRLFPYLRPHMVTLLFSALLVFASAGVALYTPKLLGKIVDKALLPKDTGLLLQLGALYAGLEFARLVCVFVQSYLLQRLGQNVMQNLRKDLFSKIIRMPIPFFDRNPSGKLVTRVTNDTVALSELFSAGFVMLLSDILLIGGVMAAVMMMQWKLGLIGLSAFPFMIFTMYYFSDRLRNAFRRSRDVLSKVNGFFAERMAGMSVVQLMQREHFEIQHFRKISTEYRDRQFDGVYLYSLFHPTITVLSAASITLVILFAPAYISDGTIQLGTFVSLLAYMQLLYQPVRNITDRYNIFLAAMSSAERIFTLLDMPEEDGLQGDLPPRVPGSSGALRFENVTFSYLANETSKPALKNMSFEVRDGETVAIVGHTGAGKTTVSSLLFRFYEPQQGRILLGGKTLNSYSKRELRERIGYVQQEVFLFSGSLRENLILLRRDVSDEKILEACVRTGFQQVLKKLPKGLDTELDERGTNLSLGERQILAFTRVFLQAPDLLVLDEATSSVDRQSEIQIQNATKELVKGRAAIIIAHRLETVMHANRIFVFQQGELIEEGNHQELLRKNGVYAHFVELQLSGRATGIQSTSSI